MAELFELSALLRLDLSAFEQQVARAESLAAGLEQQLSRLSANAASTAAAVQQAMSGLTTTAAGQTTGYAANSVQTGGAVVEQPANTVTKQPANDQTSVQGVRSMNDMPLNSGQGSISVQTTPYAEPAAAAAAAQSLQAEDIAEALAAALNGLSVQMDGEAVGRIVASTVDEQIGRAARERRYTG